MIYEKKRRYTHKDVEELLNGMKEEKEQAVKELEKKTQYNQDSVNLVSRIEWIIDQGYTVEIFRRHVTVRIPDTGIYANADAYVRDTREVCSALTKAEQSCSSQYTLYLHKCVADKIKEERGEQE